MANTIKLKRASGSDPSASDLVVGEVALRTDNGKLFTKKDDNSVAEIGGGGGGGASALNDLSDAKTDNSDAAIGIGSGALAADDGGNNTVAIGKDALNDQTSGNFNCAVGVESFSKVTSGAQNMGFGVYSGRYNTGSNNVAIGYSALEGSSGSSSGSYHTCIGEKAGEDITTANYCTLIGYRAGRDLTDGTNNTFIGALAGSATNTGTYYNTFIGYSAGSNNGNGNQNVFVGANAGLLNEAWDNVFVGNYSGDANTSGTQNVFIGKYSGTNTTSGSHNSCLGQESGNDITTGSSNTCIGHKAGNTGTNDLTEGSNNILIGHDAAASSATVSNEITLGDSNITKFRVPALNFIVKSSTATEGHVLTVDSNGEAGFAAASGGGKLTLISNTTFTSAAAAVTFTSISGYTQYKIMFSLNTSGAGTLRMRVGIDGTYDTGDNYNKGGGSDTSMQILGGFSAKSKHGEILISHLNQTKSTQVHSIGVGESNDATDSNFQTQSNGHRTTTAQNSIQIFGSSGDLSSGTISLYGIATS